MAQMAHSPETGSTAPQTIRIEANLGHQPWVICSYDFVDGCPIYICIYIYGTPPKDLPFYG